jgi:hypothetical protein
MTAPRDRCTRLGSAIRREVVATFFFLFVIIGAAPKGAAVGVRRHPHWPLFDTYPPDRDLGHSVNGRI